MKDPFIRSSVGSFGLFTWKFIRVQPFKLITNITDQMEEKFNTEF